MADITTGQFASRCRVATPSPAPAELTAFEQALLSRLESLQHTVEHLTTAIHLSLGQSGGRERK
eukprot:CAMPEP_0185559670 /NCGR_PEP_ID=MMETSP1381-20130426/55066_1 /TAXON_ID=298111 /ORGANISM="Pavlova sp., Strain CCMP459" /LENGTH=63 /DNA_ID=CAMNT_0028173303 /DNA_START=15 /DNA_END=206 /DNA_ORIENTATION=+